MFMKKLLIWIFLFLVFNFSNVLACSCIPPESPEKSLEKSNYVFIWKVIDINNNWILNGNFSWENKKNVTFEVDDVIKWENKSEITIKTAWNTAACWYNFVDWENYIVYTNWETSDLWVSLCSRTRLLDNAEEDLLAFEDILTSDEDEILWEDINIQDNKDLKLYILVTFSLIIFFLASLLFLMKIKKR